MRKMSESQELQGWKRRVVYVSLYEAIAIAITVAVLFLLDSITLHTLVTMVGAYVMAGVWNLVVNGIIKEWERRKVVKGRSMIRLIAIAIGFEGGLVLSIVPFFAWW